MRFNVSRLLEKRLHLEAKDYLFQPIVRQELADIAWQIKPIVVMIVEEGPPPDANSRKVNLNP